MKKILTIALHVIVFSNALAQNDSKLSYGAVGGALAYGVANYGSRISFHPGESEDVGIAFNMGGYIEYQLSRKIGLRTSLAYHQKSFVYTVLSSGLQTQGDVRMSYFELTPAFKYDGGSEYRKGFYMVLGPKIGFLTSATSNEESVDDAFEDTTVSVQYGIGTRIAKVVDFEIKLDYELMPFFDAGQGIESHCIGVYTSLYFDLQRILKRK